MPIFNLLLQPIYHPQKHLTRIKFLVSLLQFLLFQFLKLPPPITTFLHRGFAFHLNQYIFVNLY